MIIIKKYANRRLYDTSRSTYVNLDDLGTMVQRGETVQVLDATSGEDLTRQVLVQLLLERPGTLDVIPVGLLHRLIRTGAAAPLHPALLQQLGVALSMMDTQLSAFEQQFTWQTAEPHPSPDHPAPPPTPPPATPPPTPDAPPPAPAPPAAPASDPELDALRERLAALEARLDS